MTPTERARQAAEAIVPRCLSRTCFIKDCSYKSCWGCEDQEIERARVTAIILSHCYPEQQALGFACDECRYIFTQAEIDTEDKTVWGHPCRGANLDPRTRCESYRAPQGQLPNIEKVGVRSSKETGGAYADMKEVIKSELDRIREESQGQQAVCGWCGHSGKVIDGKCRAVYVVEDVGSGVCLHECVFPEEAVPTTAGGEGELLPCSFCGKTGILKSDADVLTWYWARCVECGAEAGQEETIKDALRNWNTRVSVSPVAARLVDEALDLVATNTDRQDSLASKAPQWAIDAAEDLHGRMKTYAGLRNWMVPDFARIIVKHAPSPPETQTTLEELE